MASKQEQGNNWGMQKAPERPRNGYVGAVHKEGTLHIAAKNGEVHNFSIPFGPDPLQSVLPSLYARLHEIDVNTHWRSLGVAGLNGEGSHVAAESWMSHGVPVIEFDNDEHESSNPHDLLEKIQEKHTPHGMRRVDVAPDGRVYSSKLVRFTDHEKTVSPNVWKENVGIIENAARALEGTVVVDDNTTAQAGGVAGMNHTKQRVIDSYNEMEEEKLSKGEEGHILPYVWLKSDGRIDPQIAAKYGIDLHDPELLAEYGEPDTGENSSRGTIFDAGGNVLIDPNSSKKRESDLLAEKWSDPDNKVKMKLNIFKLTKKRHVLLQDDADEGETYTEKDDRLYHAWNESQYYLNTKPALEKLVEEYDHVVLKEEDQQVWGKLPFIRKDFPGIEIIARNHIHSHAELAMDPSTPQHAIVTSIMKDLEGNIDAFMVHRSNDGAGRDEFIFRDASGDIDPRIADKVMYAEASFDEFDGLGRQLTEKEKPLLYAENNYNLMLSGQKLDNFELPGIGDYARDDESKRKHVGMLAYQRFAKWMHEDGFPIDQIPMFRSNAMGSIDDPSGERIHSALLIGLHPELADSISQDIQSSFKNSDRSVIEKLQAAVAETPWVADKIKKYRMTYDEYEDRNRRAIEETIEFGLQPSSAEACEDEISRKIARGTYTVVADVGGMSPQVEERVSGKAIEATDDDAEIEAYAQEMYWYFTEIYPDPEKRKAFRAGVRDALKPQYTTIANVAREVGAAALVRNHKDDIPAMVRQHRERTGHFPFVHDLLGEYKPEPNKSYTYPKAESQAIFIASVHNHPTGEPPVAFA